MNLNIDIVNRCNSRCPSCPRGRHDLVDTNDQMSPELFEKIMVRASSQFKVHEIDLYDTTEPTLHKQLPDIVRIGRKYARVCISTNAGIPNTNWDEIIKASPTIIIISITGFLPETHAKAYEGVNLNTVFKAMFVIREAKKLHNSKTTIRVLYHRYKYNLEEEKPARAFVKSLGFEFAGLWAAVLHPRVWMEKTMPQEERDYHCGTVLSPTDALEVGGKYPIKPMDCMVLAQNQNIDVWGNAKQCAAFPTVMADFLTTPIDEIQRRRATNPRCIQCASSGMVHYVCREPHLDRANAKRMGDSWYYRKSRISHWLFHLQQKFIR